MNVLVLEDRIERQETFKKLLKNMKGYFVDNIGNAEILVKEIHFDFMFLDHDLGVNEAVNPDYEKSGYQFVKYLIKEKLQKQALIIIHSCNPVGALAMLNLLKDNNYKAFLKPFTFILHETGY